MATKTISLKLEAWERLRRARRSPDESFSEVVMRAQWPEVGITAGELRALYIKEGSRLPTEGLARIEEAAGRDQAPKDKWPKR
jgi:hypothetical protein